MSTTNKDQDLKEEYDFIVVGGGTAGCTVAGRLAEINPALSILVIEAGKPPYGVKEISTPALAHTLVNSEYDWAYEATLIDRPDFNRREPQITRGKVLGGSSCLNYFSWHRGSSALYDQWEAYGGEMWNWDACKPFFLKTSLKESDDHVTISAQAEDIGAGGPLLLRAVEPLPLTKDIIEAWTSGGLPRTGDIFNGTVNGITHLVSTIHDGVRSESTVFLRDKPNITVLTQTRVGRVVLEKDDKSNEYVATGVELVDEGGHPLRIIRAKYEVILSAGVFETPRLLMLSGVGPAGELAEHGVQCRVDSPQVGRNLQEHVILAQVYQVEDGRGLDHVVRQDTRDHQAAEEEYKKTNGGPMASALLEVSAFTRLDDRLAMCKEWREAKDRLGGDDPLGPGGLPHFEYDFLPLFFPPFFPHVLPPKSGDYLTVVTSLLHPLSRGSVTLKSSNAADQPAINLNFFSEPADLAALREGARFVKEVLERDDSIGAVIEGCYSGEADLEGLGSSDEQEAGRTVMKHASTGYHPCGTCRIGKHGFGDEYEGVVDERLRVVGVQGLRVVDASVFPVIPDGRIQAAVYMVAERCAAMIKEDYGYLMAGRTAVDARGVVGFVGAAMNVGRKNMETGRKAWE